MQIIRKHISIHIALYILVFSICTCYLSVPVKAIVIDDAYQAFEDLVEVIGADGEVSPEIVRRAFYKCITQDMGFIQRDLTITEMEWMRKGWAKILNNLYGNNNKTQDNLTSDDFKRLAQYITQNVTLNEGDRSITYNDNSKSAFNTCVNEFINDCGYQYVYPFNIGLSSSSMPSGTLYSQVEMRVRNRTRPENFWYVTLGRKNGSNEYWLLSVKSSNVVGFIRGGNPVGIGIDFYDLSTWDKLVLTSDNCIYEEWDASQNNFFEKEIPWTNKDSTFSYDFNQARTNDNYYYYINCFSNNGYGSLQMFTDLNVLREYAVGVMPYYINNQVYNSWKNSSGDYTVGSNNRNNATYSNVSTYINNYYGENGTYPSSPEISIYIENYIPETPTPTPNPNNPSGGNGSVSSNATGGSSSATATATGGSANNEGINITINNNHNINLGGGSGFVSGNTVSGNGLGSSGGIGGIFDFLSQIGDFLGSLIKNIGNVLADIVTGIGSVVSSLLEVIPTVFNDFLGGVLGWLPPELRALVTLSISAMIIVGLIKLFRG